LLVVVEVEVVHTNPLHRMIVVGVANGEMEGKLLAEQKLQELQQPSKDLHRRKEQVVEEVVVVVVVVEEVEEEEEVEEVVVVVVVVP